MPGQEPGYPANVSFENKQKKDLWFKEVLKLSAFLCFLQTDGHTHTIYVYHFSAYVYKNHKNAFNLVFSSLVSSIVVLCTMNFFNRKLSL